MKPDIHAYLRPDMHAHLIGIGGVSMSPLADVLHKSGMIITGSDLSESATVQHLRSLGITVYQGHHADHISGADCIIRTAAVHDDNPEIAVAHQAGIPVFERAEAWGAIMKQYQNALCVSGTHGKTTTTSMCTEIFMAAHRDPTVMIGGILPSLGTGHRVGQGDTIILESCEYYNSFHAFSPTVAIILNVDADHLDFFKDLEDIQNSFRHFASLVPEQGWVIANADDLNTMNAIFGLNRPILTFGIQNGTVTAQNITWNNGFATFDLMEDGVCLGSISLQVPGIHNVYNALAAACAARKLNIPLAAIQEGLHNFTGAGRRFEYKGHYHGAAVYDDYAHHPSELHALFTAVKNLDYKRIICAFQPHTYTRTKELFDEFLSVLRLPDLVLLAEIYAAREQNTLGISSMDLVKQLPNAQYCVTLADVTEQLKELAQPGDLILTVGAGDIYRAGEQLLSLS